MEFEELGRSKAHWKPMDIRKLGDFDFYHLSYGSDIMLWTHGKLIFVVSPS